ncbi:hypothetical protein DRN73_08960 [Candidatus Pacearchaeota archaeon]|nr:MAG: hypothetical protein DRN73_08960 [Candidatus Pacearchaeota archaeon]
MKIGVFVSCSDLDGKRALKLCNFLNKFGYNVSILKTGKCCGAPLFYSGFLEKSFKLIKYNKRFFEKYDIILSYEPTCAGFIKENYQLDSKVNVYEVFEFFEDMRLYERMNLNLKHKVYFHLPCHLRLNDFEKIKKFLKRIKNLYFLEDKCCGLSGSYFLDNFKISLKILKDRNLPKGKYILSSNCSICLMALKIKSFKKPVKHLLDILLDIQNQG